MNKPCDNKFCQTYDDREVANCGRYSLRKVGECPLYRLPPLGLTDSESKEFQQLGQMRLHEVRKVDFVRYEELLGK